MRVQNFFLTLAHRLIVLLLTLIVVAEVAHAKPPKSGDMNKFTENNPSIESPSTPFIDPSGKEVTLHEFKNNWTLLNFWATWCAPCISELPSLAKLESKINNSKFKLLLISISLFNIFCPIFSLFFQLWRPQDQSQLVDLIFPLKPMSSRASETPKVPHS